MCGVKWFAAPRPAPPGLTTPRYHTTPHSHACTHAAAGSRGAADIMADYDPSGSLWGAPGTPPPSLDDAALPFSRSLLTFGSGMGVKMMVTRLQQVCACAVLYWVWMIL